MRPFSILGVTVALIAALVLATSAGATGTNTRIPFTVEFFNPCRDGEPFTATGFMHVTSDATFGLDLSLHDRYHLNLEGMTAKGLLSGVKYVVQQEWNVGTNSDEDHLTMHDIYKEHYVRSGEDGTLFPDDDFYFYVHTHLTLNASGGDNFKVEAEAECR
jgi:hypothetical protein